jgi:hypothetical protein
VEIVGQDEDPERQHPEAQDWQEAQGSAHNQGAANDNPSCA